VQASLEWLAESAAEFQPDEGRFGYAQLRHYTAAYTELGSGPPLVLVPGLAGGFELLGPLARLLARHFRVLCYQLRGEDDPFALRRSFGMVDLVEDLEEFLAWHRLERPAVFGVSFGGTVALELAARYPQRLRALIVQGTGAKFERGLLQRVAGMILSGYPLPADSPFVNQFFNLLFGGRQRDQRLFEFVTRQCWQTDQSVMAHRFRLVERYDLTPRAPRIAARSLILTGDRDLLVSEASLAALAKGIPHAKQVRLARCGHLAFVTQPDRVAEEVRQFLEG
jgi:pimeloyl-ACP methyl ester carboxylesterase